MSAVLAGCTTAPQAARAPGSTARLAPAPSVTTQPVTDTGTADAHALSVEPVALRGSGTRIPAGDTRRAGTVLTTFGLDLWKRVRPAGGNSVISPYSADAVLAMARAGAAGTTATQFDQVLGTDERGQAETVTTVDAALAGAVAQGAAADSGDRTVIRGANSLWPQQGLAVSSQYLDQLTRDYGAALYPVDYQAAPVEAAGAINRWVALRTAGLIPHLVADNAFVGGTTVLSLVNATYLKAQWAQEFSLDPSKLTFVTPRGASRVQSITAEGAFTTADGKGWQSVTIPYRGGGLAMTVILPDRGAFEAIVGSLTPATLRTAQGGRLKQMRLTMPTLSLNVSAELTDAVQGMGATDAFDHALADFSPITGARGLFAAGIGQADVVRVDEIGTEAAVATIMSMAESSAAPVPPGAVLVVDRPYLFSIQDTKTGAPLFLGAVTDPSH